MFAHRIKNLAESPVREILKVIDRPGMISFAGGLPAAECFPTFDYASLSSRHMQYGPSEGDDKLREQVAQSLCKRGLQVESNQVLILSGSQQGIDLVAKLFVEPGVKVAVEVPTYLAALQAFDLFGAEYRGYSIGEPGIIDSGPGDSKISGTRLTYTIPTFQNPTGHCYSSEQRKTLAAACDATGSILFEDDPYRDLVYSDCDRTPVCAYMQEVNWIYQGSFSKSYAPGLRLGYLACSKTLFPQLVRLKQAADLHSCRLSQQLISALLETHDDRNLIGFYQKRRDNFQEVLQDTFTHLADWKRPDGGLFFWLKLKPAFAMDTRLLLDQSIAQGVAFMPGEAFYPAGTTPQSTLRLNFSHSTPELARSGLEVLAGIIETAAAGRVQQSNSV